MAACARCGTDAELDGDALCVDCFDRVEEKAPARPVQDIRCPHCKKLLFPLRLPPREYETLALMAQGYSNAEMAWQMGIGVKYAENLVNNIYRRLGINGDQSGRRVKAVLRYQEYARDFLPEVEP